MSFQVLFRCVFCMLVLTSASAQTASGQTAHAKTITPHITSDVIGVVYFDLERLELEPTLRVAARLGFQMEDEFADLVDSMPKIVARIDELKQAGFSQAYGLLRSSDIQSRGTTWVLPLKPGSDSTAAKTAFERIVVPLYPDMFREIETGKDAIFVAATSSQMKVRELDQPGESLPRLEMWKALGDGTAGLVMFGDADSRRVLGELLPPLPAPFESIDGKLIAEGLEWAGVELKLGEKPDIKFVVQARDEQVASVIEKNLIAGGQLLQQLPQTKQYIPESEMNFVLKELAPTRIGSQVTISSETLTTDLERLSKVMSPQVKLARSKAAQSARLNRLRQLVLANLNFESAYMRFPTQASVSQSGQPLLSWRVQILPFLGKKQNELYNQFHLDEAWNSEHNMKLVQEMPEIYRDPNPASHQNNKTGKTIYLGVAGDGMIFRGTKEVTFGEITDGSSNTMLMVAAAPEHAVPWTQPRDWQVDLDDPTAQLKSAGRTTVEFAMADGSVHRIPISKDDVIWRRLVQAADGEVVSW